MGDQAAAMQSHIPLPPKLDLGGNISQTWKTWKQIWNSYVIVTGLADKDNAYQVATFITCIGHEALEVYNGLPFRDENEKNDPTVILRLMEEYCVGKTNTIYERYVFNNKHQESSESVDAYVTKLRKLSLTCEFGQLADQMIRDRIVCGIKDNAVRKKLLQEADLSLQKCVDICRAAEKTATQIKSMNLQDEVHALNKSSRKPLKANAPHKEQRKGGKPHHAGGKPHHASGKSHQAKKTSCSFCGYQHPREKEACPAYGKVCANCGNKNHFKSVCRQPEKRVHLLENCDSDSTSDDEILSVEQTSGKEHPKKLFARMKINDQSKLVKFQIDCGATCNVLSQDIIPKNVRFHRGQHTLRVYNGQEMKTIGACEITLTNPKNGESYDENFVVVNSGSHPILGSSTSQRMKLIAVQHDNIMNIEDSAEDRKLSMEEIEKKFGDIFTGNGRFSEQVHLEVDNTVPPVKLPLRRVPVAIKPLLQQELKRLEGLQVIEAVNQPTDWVSSLLAFKKSNGKLRICIDPKPLNKALRRSHYPLPIIEDILPDLAKARIFTLCDVKNGFWHVELDEPSSYLTTFETPYGRYRWRRLPFGISPAPEIFQHRLELAIQNLPGVKAVADDILIYGEGESEEEAIRDHDQKLSRFLYRCREQGIKLNKDKFKLRLKEMPYIGHVLTTKGLKPDPHKVQAIIDFETPKDVAGVHRFLGLVNYLAKFMNNLSVMCDPIGSLIHKNVVWRWTHEHEEAFSKIKEAISQAPVLKYFDSKLETTLQCDASSTGLGATLLQQGQPIAYASRALTPAEQQYAQIEKELLAVVFGMERFNQYTYGRKVLVESDHKPLEIIHKKPLISAPKRLQRMFLRLQKYEIEIMYKPGKEMYVADALSRAHPKKLSKEACTEEVFKIFEDINMVEYLPISQARMLKIKQTSDVTHELLKKTILEGWPRTKESTPMEVHPYFHVRDELSVQDGIVYRGTRCVIPKGLRAEVMRKLHQSHIGAEGCLRRARECVYWPGMNSEIKDLVSKCDTCRTYEPSQQKETLISHETPNRPWSVVGVDLFQSPVSNDQYLITVDYFSNFFEIDRLETTSSAAVINKLKQHFARHGIPDKVISDNGPQFSSQQFSNFKHMWEFDHRTSSPAYPQSNGKAENAVKSAKQLMRKAKHSGQDPWLAVLDFRNTPSQGIGESPCQRLMNRRTKTLMPVKESLLSSVGDRANIKNMRKEKDRQAHYYNRTAKDLRELQPGDTVRMKPTQLRDKEWKKGTIIGREGSRSYNVQTQDGTYRRNRSHLKDTREERNDFTVFPEYTSPSIEDLPENDRKPAIDETADLEQNANDQPMVITSSEVTTNRESAPTTRYGRVVKPPRYLENYVQAVYNV